MGELALRITAEREDDGRWIGEVPALPGVLAYGATKVEARTKATALALRVLADRVEHGEPVPVDPNVLFTDA
jgi:predicted RNase H-like HicB family nuclease